MAASLALTAAIAIRDGVAGETTPLYLKAAVVVFGSLVAMLVATFLTAPVQREKLEIFHRRVRPGGFWPFPGGGFGRRLWLAWIGGVASIYASMFLLGSLVLRRFDQLPLEATVLIAGMFGLYWGLRRDGFS